MQREVFIVFSVVLSALLTFPRDVLATRYQPQILKRKRVTPATFILILSTTVLIALSLERQPFPCANR